MTRDAHQAVRLHHRVDGDPTAPAVVLGSSIGTTLAMWDPQVEALAEHWRVIRFDTRGHGGSEVPDGPYSAEGLAADVLALVDELGVDRFAYGGVSLGGLIGQQLAIDQPDRVRSLVLCCTAARFGEPDGWHERAARVRTEGTGWLVDFSRDRWFTEQFSARSPEQVERLLSMLRETAPEGYAGCCEALAGFDSRPRLEDIEASTLVVAGEGDPATPPAMAEDLSEGIPDAELLVVPQSAHLASVEQAAVVTPAIVDHLRRTAP
jgi:3-oxoadipate enol-lactonase